MSPTTTYSMSAASETLVAESLDELAELTELALEHQDNPHAFRAHDAGANQLRQLAPDEFEALLVLVRARLQGSHLPPELADQVAQEDA